MTSTMLTVNVDRGDVVLLHDQVAAEIRRAIRDGEAKPGEILHDAYRQINNLLAAGKDVVFDTTGANPAVRKAALSIAAKHGAQTSAVVLDTSLATCLDAQKGRARPVSGAEVCRIHADVQKQIPGLAGEGFGSVRVTRDRR